MARVRHLPQPPASPPLCETGVFSSSLDHLETNRHSPGVFIQCSRFGSADYDSQPATYEEQAFRHSGWAPRRHAIWLALCRTGGGNARKDRFANCGASLWLQTNAEHTELHVSCDKCHDRFCIACQNEKAALIRERLAQHCSGRTVRFVTLTLRHSKTSLADQIDRLYACFTRFRHRRSWTSHVSGGVAFFEGKVSKFDGLWHVHLHILLEGAFWEQRELSAEWHAVTGDSSIVDVRACPDIAAASSYVTKYLTKPADTSVYAKEETLDEFVLSMKGRKLALPFGTWRSMNLMATPDCLVEWITIASISTLVANSRHGDLEATRWLDAAARKWPLFAKLFLHERPPP